MKSKFPWLHIIWELCTPLSIITTVTFPFCLLICSYFKSPWNYLRPKLSWDQITKDSGINFHFLASKWSELSSKGLKNGPYNFSCVPAFYLEPHYRLFKESSYSSMIAGILVLISSFDWTKTTGNSKISSFPFCFL